MKTAIIAIAKSEEPYIEEWINYHLDKGFSRIIIADNDDSLILSKYESERVVIENYTGVELVQPIAYKDLFLKYRSEYDWILFIDVDEFLVLENYNNVNAYLQSLPQDVDMIRLNCKHYDDNDELDVVDGNYNVFNRFTTPISCENDRFAKSFVNTKVNREIRFCGHGLVGNFSSVDAEGMPCNSLKKLDYVLHRTAWINHYRTKTIGEYIRQKYQRGGPNKNPLRYSNWKWYFKVTNNLTPEKIEYAQKVIDSLST